MASASAVRVEGLDERKRAVAVAAELGGRDEGERRAVVLSEGEVGSFSSVEDEVVGVGRDDVGVRESAVMPLESVLGEGVDADLGRVRIPHVRVAFPVARRSLERLATGRGR